MKLSKKKRTLLYDTIHEDIMQVRIKLGLKFKDTKYWNDIDNLLYKFHIDCPEKAVRLFDE